MNKTDEYYMEIALQQAQKAFVYNEIPVGCVIVCGDQIIAKTFNLKEANQDATAHAEILAIQQASKHIGNWRLDDCKLYVTLEPCAMCASAIVQARIKKVVIGALDNKKGAVISSKHIFENNHNHKLIVKTKVLEFECRNMLDEFLQSKRQNSF